MSFVKGLAKLHRQFDAIENSVVKRALRSVLNKAGTPILKAAKSEAPTKRGHLKKALAKRFWANPDKSRAGVAIGVKDNYRAPNPDWKPGSEADKTFVPKNYLHMVIFGTAAHYSDMSKGKSVTRQDGTPRVRRLIAAAAPNDFLGRAQRASQTAARQILADGIKPAIKAAALKVGGPK